MEQIRASLTPKKPKLYSENSLLTSQRTTTKDKGDFSLLPLQQAKNRKNYEMRHFSTSTKSSEKRERLILLHDFESDMLIYNQLGSTEHVGAIPET